MTFKNHHDAKRVLEVLGKRLARFGLTLHPDKTRFIDFRPSATVARMQTARTLRSTFSASPTSWVKVAERQERGAANDGQKPVCPRADRDQRLVPNKSASADPDQRARLSAKLVGHYAYYGITGNSRQLHRYHQQVTKTWRKWLERRTSSKRLPWESFGRSSTRHSLPRPRSCTATLLSAKLSHEEPDAVILRVRVCGG